MNKISKVLAVVFLFSAISNASAAEVERVNLHLNSPLAALIYQRGTLQTQQMALRTQRRMDKLDLASYLRALKNTDRYRGHSEADIINELREWTGLYPSVFPYEAPTAKKLVRSIDESRTTLKQLKRLLASLETEITQLSRASASTDIASGAY